MSNNPVSSSDVPPPKNLPPKNSFTRSGFVIIDKPKGFSSAVIVGKVKRGLGAVKVGHAGTLDPDATGLLVCLVNGATKIAPLIHEGRKVYEGTFRFGLTTTSDDMAGDVLTTSEELPSQEAVQAIIPHFLGVIQQVPPRVSAIQIDGRRAYDMERKGEDFELASRSVTVHNLRLTLVDNATYHYHIECGAGTYIRAIARDMGRMLGCGGVVETLRRTASGPADLTRAIQIEDLCEEAIIDWPALLPHLPIVDIPLPLARDLLQGREYALDAFVPFAKHISDERAIYRLQGRDESCGILKRIEGKWGYLVSSMPQFGLGKSN